MLDNTLHLGELRSVHRFAARYTRWFFFSLGKPLIAIAFLFSVMPTIAANIHTRAGLAALYLIYGAMVLGLIIRPLWQWTGQCKATLQVFQYGLAYTIGDTTQTCKWDELQSISVRPERATIAYVVRKANGEEIKLTEAIEGIEEIVKRIDDELETRRKIILK